MDITERGKIRHRFLVTPNQFEGMNANEVNSKKEVTGRPRVMDIYAPLRLLSLKNRRKGKNERRVRQIGKVLVRPGFTATFENVDTTVIKLTHREFDQMLKRWERNKGMLHDMPYVFSKDQKHVYITAKRKRTGENKRS